MQAHAPGRFSHPRSNVETLGVGRGMTVVDFGAGSGHYALELAFAVGEEGRVYAIDVQQDLLRRLKTEAHRRGLSNIETILADVERPHGTKLSGGIADLILMSNVLFQLEHPRAAFAEAHRILRPGGRLAVIDWSDSFRSMGPAKRHVYAKSKALADAAGAGFRARHEFVAGAHHFGLLLAP